MEILTYARACYDSGFVCEDGCCLSVRDGHGMLITDAGVDFAKITEGGLVSAARNANLNKEFAIHMSIYHAVPTAKVIMHIKPKYALIASKLNITPRSNLELHAEAFGRKLNIVTSMPQRVAETLVKDKECLMLNSGLWVIGNSFEQAFQRATRIEEAIFTYITAKTIDKRASARKMPAEKLYISATDRARTDNGAYSGTCCIVKDYDKLCKAIRALDEDNMHILAQAPVFVGIFAHATLEIPNIVSVEYDSLSNKKYLAKVASVANRDGVVLLRGRGLLIVDDSLEHANEVLQQCENYCRKYAIESIQHTLGQEDAGLKDIPLLFAQTIGMRSLPVL